MGQAQGSNAAPFVFRDNLRRHAFELKQAAYSLSYNEFLASLEELNDM